MAWFPRYRLSALLAIALAPGCSATIGNPENLNSVLWVQTSSEYAALSRQSYVTAAERLEQASSDPGWTAVLEQDAGFSELPPAIIIDVDETVLDNSAYQAWLLLENRTYDAESWNEWCEEAAASAVPGALDFLTEAAGRGVTIFYVTNRRHVVEPATRENLERLGFPIDTSEDSVLTRGENGWEGSDKAARRAHVARRYRVLLLLGDNLGDFLSPASGTIEERRARARSHADRWGRSWIVLPNPMYGSWETALLEGGGFPNADARVRAKQRHLKRR